MLEETLHITFKLRRDTVINKKNQVQARKDNVRPIGDSSSEVFLKHPTKQQSREIVVDKGVRRLSDLTASIQYTGKKLDPERTHAVPDATGLP